MFWSKGCNRLHLGEVSAQGKGKGTHWCSWIVLFSAFYIHVQTADPKPASSPSWFEDFAEPELKDYVKPEPSDEWYGIDPLFYEG